MKTIEAFKCEHTGAVFETDVQAARSEFRALMRKAADHLPAMGSIAPKDIFDWLAGNLIGAPYVSALPALMEALTYLQQNRVTIDDRKLSTRCKDVGEK